MESNQLKEFIMYKECKECVGDNYSVMKKSLIDGFTDKAQHCPFCGRYLGENDYHASEPSTIINRGANNVLGDREETHPAYAQLQFSRQSGGHSNLYGSAIKHQETIVMRVSNSKKISCEYSERYYTEHNPLIEVRMSQTQFSQAITSMNMGSGVPVTLESLRGKQMPKCEEESVAEIANRGLEQKIKKFADSISSGQARIKEILVKKGTIKVAERKEIGDIYGSLMQDLRSNIPFLHECMTEAYDKTANAAKADIEAFYTNAIMKMGMDALDEKRIAYKVNDAGRLEFDTDVVDAEIVK